MRATVVETILVARDRRDILRAMSIVRSTLMMSSNTKNVTAATVYSMSQKHKISLSFWPMNQLYYQYLTLLDTPTANT